MVVSHTIDSSFIFSPPVKLELASFGQNSREVVAWCGPLDFLTISSTFKTQKVVLIKGNVYTYSPGQLDFFFLHMLCPSWVLFQNITPLYTSRFEVGSFSAAKVLIEKLNKFFLKKNPRWPLYNVTFTMEMFEPSKTLACWVFRNVWVELNSLMGKQIFNFICLQRSGMFRSSSYPRTSCHRHFSNVQYCLYKNDALFITCTPTFCMAETSRKLQTFNLCELQTFNLYSPRVWIPI